MATERVSLTRTAALAATPGLCCGFGGGQAGFWIRWWWGMAVSDWDLGSQLPALRPGLRLPALVCVPRCAPRKLVMKTFFCFCCLKVRHCLWEAPTAYGEKMGLKE